MTHTVRRLAVFLGAGLVFAALAGLPLVPWLMGITRGPVRHVYTDTLPEDNRGAYLLTAQGVMQLFRWLVLPEGFPEDAPTLPAAGLRSIAVVQKQFFPPDSYVLLRLDNGEREPWLGIHQESRRLLLDPGPLPPGDYAFLVATDSLFGGTAWHFFRLLGP